MSVVALAENTTIYIIPLVYMTKLSVAETVPPTDASDPPRTPQGFFKDSFPKRKQLYCDNCEMNHF